MVVIKIFPNVNIIDTYSVHINHLPFLFQCLSCGKYYTHRQSPLRHQLLYCPPLRAKCMTGITESSPESPSKEHEVAIKIEEISENLALLILNGISKLEDDDNWEIICNRVEELATMKAKEYESLTQKTVFKMMDIQDEL